MDVSRYQDWILHGNTVKPVERPIFDYTFTPVNRPLIDQEWKPVNRPSMEDEWKPANRPSMNHEWTPVNSSIGLWLQQLIENFTKPLIALFKHF